VGTLADLKESFPDIVKKHLSPEDAREFEDIHEIIENVGTDEIGTPDKGMESLGARMIELVEKAMKKLYGE